MNQLLAYTTFISFTLIDVNRSKSHSGGTWLDDQGLMWGTIKVFLIFVFFFLFFCSFFKSLSIDI